MSQHKVSRPKIVDHRHCKVCGKAVPPNKEFCSEECRLKYEDWQARERRVKRMIYVFYALIIGSMLLFLLIRATMG